MVTIDTNIAFYAMVRNETGIQAQSELTKSARAKVLLSEVQFLSVQVLNEYAFSARRKLRREWEDIDYDLELLRNAVGDIRSIDDAASRYALRIAIRYQLTFFDSLMISVALANDASVIYSEDMHHGLVIDGRLTITNPFRE